MTNNKDQIKSANITLRYMVYNNQLLSSDCTFRVRDLITINSRHCTVHVAYMTVVPYVYNH